MHSLTCCACQISLCHAKMEKYLKKNCHDQQRWGGGQFLGFMGEDTAVMRGDIELMGDPLVPPLGKTLVMVDFLNNAVSFLWDFTIAMQTKNMTDVSVTKLWSVKQNDKPGNRKNLFLSLSNIVNLGII